jgi:hypothetical protein
LARFTAETQSRKVFIYYNAANLCLCGG